MTSRRLVIAGGLLIAVLFGLVLFVWLPRTYSRASAPVVTPRAAAPVAEQPSRKIKARLFYVSDDGQRLTAVEREVPFAERPADQAREIIKAQLAVPEAPLV